MILKAVNYLLIFISKLIKTRLAYIANELEALSRYFSATVLFRKKIKLF